MVKFERLGVCDMMFLKGMNTSTVSVDVKIEILSRVDKLHFKMSSKNTVRIYQLGDQNIDGWIIKKYKETYVTVYSGLIRPNVDFCVYRNELCDSIEAWGDP